MKKTIPQRTVNSAALFTGWILAMGILLPVDSLNAAEPAMPTAEQIVAGHLKATGDRARLESIKTEIIKGTGSERGREFDMEIQIQAPDKFLFIGTMGEGFTIRMSLSSNGKGWRQEGESVRTFEGEAATGMYNHFLGLNVPALLRLNEPGTKFELLGTTNQGAQKLYVVRSISGAGAKQELKFDVTTGLLAQYNYVDVSDYRNVEGLKLPFVLGGKDSFKFTVKEVTYNAPLKPGTFDKPAGIDVTSGKDAYRTRLSPPGQLAIVRQPPPMNFGKRVRKTLPTLNPERRSSFEMDLRGNDCSALDLQDRAKDLLRADFDDKTQWPKTLPEGFDPKKIMETGKNPGLRVRDLHRQGITGKGVGLAIIDQHLLVDHVEYRDRLKLYEEIHTFQGEPFASMHAPAVASIAVGKTVGVAPDAELYFIAETHGEIGKDGKFEWDFAPTAQAIERILAVNQGLPANRKIRVISISVGWTQDQKGFAEVNAAVEKARQAGIFVISTSLESTHKLAFHGLGREPMQNPEDYQSYGPGSWWAKLYYDGKWRFTPAQRLLVPMDARCTASPTAPEDYVFYANGGWSWSVPYLAGLYALACQVNPEITPEAFWAAAIKTGNTVKLKHGDETHEFGTIANPVALIAALKAK